MKEIIENVKLVENAPLEEPARQYYFMEKAKEYVSETQTFVFMDVLDNLVPLRKRIHIR